jgi:hypothetical protein
MTESAKLRRYAKEALRWASKSKDQAEKQHLIGLACMLATAAAASELNRVAVDDGDRANKKAPGPKPGREVDRHV